MNDVTEDLTAGGSALNRAWRLVGTALSFLAFGVGGLIMGIAIMPLLWLTPRRVRIRVARRLVTGGFRGFVGLMRWLRVLDYNIVGFDKLGDLSSCLIVANHPTLIDVVFLLAWFPRATCVVKGAHWSNPVMMGSVRAADYISNADPEVLIERCIARLAAGGHVILFPEGTRTVPGKPLDFRRGAATIALAAGADCVPVLIECEPTTLTKAESWYHIPKRRVQITLTALPRVTHAEMLTRGETTRQAAFEFTRELKEQYSQRLGRTIR